MPRGKKKKYQDYDFQDLLPKDIEKQVNDILNFKSYDLSQIKNLIKSIYNFYNEKTNLKPNDFSVFEEYFISKMEKYIAFQEISFFYYIKRAIEEKYKLINKKRYFSIEQEAAFKTLLRTNDNQRKNILYERFLKNAFEKMVESIIHRYKLYSREISYEDLQAATVSFLHEKMHHYDPTKGYKAYSYLGTIAVRKLKNDQRKEYQKLKRCINHEDTYTEFGDDERLVYHQKPYEDNLNVTFFAEIPSIIDEYIEENKYEEFLTESDVTIGRALIQVLENWDNIFDMRGNPSNKFKKNSIFEILRNMTGLQTKHVTQALKVYKELYFRKKHDYIQKNYSEYEDII